MIVRLSGFVLTEGVERRVDVQSEVNARRLQGVHAIIVVRTIIYGVDANGINFQFLEPIDRGSANSQCQQASSSLLGDISFAGIDVGNRID